MTRFQGAKGYDDDKLYAGILDLNDDGRWEYIISGGCGSGGCDTGIFAGGNTGLRMILDGNVFKNRS